MKSLERSARRGAALAVAAFVLLGTLGRAQQAPAAASTPSGDAAIRDLQEQVRQLRGMMSEMRDEMRAENAQSQAEMHQLRQELQTTRAMLDRATNPANPVTAVASANSGSAAPTTPAAAPAASAAPPLEDRVQKLEEATSLIGSKIDEQYQTKVETASKYRARLHGIVLMNAFHNSGNSDNLDFPNYAETVFPGWSKSNIGATLRQSEIGFEIFGPNIGGAKTSADVQFDFAGGFPATGNGVNFGVVRLQTASLRFDWENTSIVAGQDSLFISPLSPTSFASLATPAFAFAGNLWGWTPQVRVEHRFSVSDQQTLTVQAGVLDNLDWEYPVNPFYRWAQAGEMSAQPAYALRTAWSRPVNQHPLSLGVAGYYGRQDWTWNRNVDAWAAMADWQVPLLPRLGLSGEFYRGRGIGGLGAAIGTSIVYGGTPNSPFSPIRGVDTAGGWSQLKLSITPKLDLNGVYAEDDAFTANIRGFAIDQNNFGPILGKNRGTLGNVVYRPRSDLVLSAEFRRLRTWPVYSDSVVTNQVNLAVGILF